MTAAGQLLLTLTGVRLLFACLQSNGAMEAAAHRVLGLSRGRVALLPLVLFVLAALLAMVGPGAILSAALLAPMAMRTGVPVGISPFLIALMIGNGANAGNLSPFSSIGVIVNGLMTRSGLGGHGLRVWVFHAAAHLAVALGAYLFFGGFRLSWRTTGTAHQNIPPFTRPQAVSLVALFLWMAAVIALRWPLGWTAPGLGMALLLFAFAPWRVAVAKMPWKVIAMVVTISTAVGLIEQAGGLQWFQAPSVPTPRR